MTKHKIKLRKQLKDILYKKYRDGHGKPKHEIKDIHNSTPYIHSKSTYDSYVKRVDAFCNWCKVEGITEKKEAKAISEFVS